MGRNRDDERGDGDEVVGSTEVLKSVHIELNNEQGMLKFEGK
jgi:hypothetical protein